MALEEFNTDDSLDDGEEYGIFTNREGSGGNGQVADGVYKSNHSTTSGMHAYLVTTDDIGSTFEYQVEFEIISGNGYHDCGIYLGSSIPTGSFDAASVSTNLICVYVNYTFKRLYIIRTSSSGTKEYWNFSTKSWQSTAYYVSIYATYIYIKHSFILVIRCAKHLDTHR